MQRDERPATAAQIEYATDLLQKLEYDLDWYDLDKMSRSQISRLIDELAKRRVGGLTMDIKERIDALTEAEAKSALGVMLAMYSYNMPCECCEVYIKYGRNVCPALSCMSKLLDETLKEARK